MPAKKKSAKTRSNKFTEQAKANIKKAIKKAEGDVEKAIETNEKLNLELKKVKTDLSRYPYNPAYGGPRC
jgi:regulator of replication initiation timing